MIQQHKLGKPSLYGDKYPAHDMHPRVGEFVVRETADKGMALMALVGFKAGEIMARFDGLTTSTITQHSLQMREGEHILDTDFIGMLAHSCSPNVRLDMEAHHMIALADIWPGEVLAMDYASTEDYLFRTFPCSCGSDNCRRVITGIKQAVPVSRVPTPAEQEIATRTASLESVRPKPKEYRCIERYGVRYYGQHAMITARGCNEGLLDIPYMKRFLAELADFIGMVRFGDAHVHRFGSGIEVGLSGFQLIETSQVSFHSNDGAQDIYLDVFSCKQYRVERVEEFVQQWLNPKTIETQQLWRQ